MIQAGTQISHHDQSEDSKSTSNGLVVFADDWNRHPSSAQHLIRRIRKEMPVLWVNTIGTRSIGANHLSLKRVWEKLQNWSSGLKQVDDQMWVVDVPMLPNIGARASRFASRQMVTQYLRWCLKKTPIRNPTIITTLPHISWLVGDIGQEGLVYYCTDDFSNWPSADQAALMESEDQLVRRADLILPVSQQLMQRHRSSGRCQFFPHAVDFAHFAQAKQIQQCHVELARLPKPRVGYFGLIYEKLDFELLAGVSQVVSNGSLVMIGPTAWCPEEFTNLPNVTFTGAQPYETLPEWLAGLDVLLLPYRSDDEMIRQSSPLKLRECLATGKPTICVDVPEARNYEPHVCVTSSHEEFLNAVRNALEFSESGSQSVARQAAVQAETWDARALLLAELIRTRPMGREIKTSLSTVLSVPR